MVDRKEITVVILPNGEITLTTHGFKGEECDEALKPFERELGKPTQKSRTPEYYEKSDASRKKKITTQTK